MATFYSFVQSEMVTVFVPPDGSYRAYRVTGLEPESGVYFQGYIPEVAYRAQSAIVATMDGIGQWVNEISKLPGVTGMASVETQDAQLQVKDWFDVDVVSTSGNSTATVRVPYPSSETGEIGLVVFGPIEAKIADAVKVLDAGEAS